MAWTDTGLSAVLQVPVAGGAAITLQSGIGGLQGVGVARGYVGFASFTSTKMDIWQDLESHVGSTNIWALDNGSLSVQPAFALSGQGEWWCAIDSMYSRCCPFLNSGSCSSVTGSTSVTTSRMAVNSTHFYWTDKAGGKVEQVPWTASTVGSLTHLETARVSPDLVAADNSYVYWVEGANIERVSVGGGAPTQLPWGGYTWTSLASDGSTMYFSGTSGGTGYVYGASPNGSAGTITTFSAVAATNPTGLVYAGGALYWFDSATNKIYGVVFP